MELQRHLRGELVGMFIRLKDLTPDLTPRSCTTCIAAGCACHFWQDLRSFACLKCQHDKRRCSNIDLLKQISANRNAATTLDLARTKISKPEHINELGVEREAAIILGQILSAKKRTVRFNRKVNKSLSQIHRRLDAIEQRVGMGVDRETEQEGGNDKDGGV
jgi:hypothetical protein